MSGMSELLLSPKLTDEESDDEDSRSSSFPLLLDEQHRPLTRYLQEKITGVRRSTGALKLKKLSVRHLKIISLHMAGWTGGAIAVQMNCAQITISKILNDPLAKEILDRAAEDVKGEISALIPLAVNAVRTGLGKESSITTQFKAISQLEKLQNMTDSRTADKTAEDLIQELLSKSINIQTNVQVNVETKE